MRLSRRPSAYAYCRHAVAGPGNDSQTFLHRFRLGFATDCRCDYFVQILLSIVFFALLVLMLIPVAKHFCAATQTTSTGNTDLGVSRVSVCGKCHQQRNTRSRFVGFGLGCHGIVNRYCRQQSYGEVYCEPEKRHSQCIIRKIFT
jgi:hypothetical protein